MPKINCVAISDLHNSFPKNLPSADVLFIAGDLTNKGEEGELLSAKAWLEEQKKKFKHILFTPGNHDITFETKRQWAEETLGLKAYINEIVEIEGVKIFLSPYSVQFGDWAFMKPDYSLANTVASWPLDIDVAVVHGPPKYLRDMVAPRAEHVGSDAIKWWLNKAIDQGQIKLFICGHIHDSFGLQEYRGIDILNVAQGWTFAGDIDQHPVEFTIDTETKKVEYP